MNLYGSYSTSQSLGINITYNQADLVSPVTVEDYLAFIDSEDFTALRNTLEAAPPGSKDYVAGDWDKNATDASLFACDEDGWLFAYTGNETDVRVPSFVGGYTVVNIDSEAFQGNTTITSVAFPDTVEKLGSDVFKDCTSLKTVSFPETFRYIGTSAFENAAALTDVKLPAAVTFIGLKAFANAGQGVFTVDDAAKVEYGSDVFRGSGFRSINMGKNGFVSAENAATTLVIDCEKLEELVLCGGLTTLDNAFFQNCSSLRTLEIPDSVTSFGNGDMFTFPKTLESVKLPSGLKALPAG
jgi:hypothetical protein